MTTVALVHGAWHGAWCFARLADQLAMLGHRPVAIDLPISDVDAGAARYAAVIVSALRDCPDDVVLLGHSMGGLAIPLVPALRPIRRLVFLCALLPRPGNAFDSPGSSVPPAAAGLGVDEAGTSRWTGDRVLELLYGDCDGEVARSAARSLRPQASLPFTEVTPLRSWPEVPSTAIYCAEDRTVPPALFAPVARDLLGREPLLFPGGHSPFLTRPAELAAVLHSVVLRREGVGGDDR